MSQIAKDQTLQYILTMLDDVLQVRLHQANCLILCVPVILPLKYQPKKEGDKIKTSKIFKHMFFIQFHL